MGLPKSERGSPCPPFSSVSLSLPSLSHTPRHRKWTLGIPTVRKIFPSMGTDLISVCKVKRLVDGVKYNDKAITELLAAANRSWQQKRQALTSCCCCCYYLHL